MHCKYIIVQVLEVSCTGKQLKGLEAETMKYHLCTDMFFLRCAVGMWYIVYKRFRTHKKMDDSITYSFPSSWVPEKGQ